MLRVRMFGTFAMEADGVALPLPARRRACSLLGWIALHPGMHPRSEVAARFWPDVLDSSARKSLRTELVAVRQALGAQAGAVAATRDTVGLAGDEVLVDAREFDRLVREERLLEAVDLCRGELLAGLDDDWIYEARELHRLRAPLAEIRRATADTDALVTDFREAHGPDGQEAHDDSR